MRHWVNFGLLFCFLTLAATGVMSYVLPFKIETARVHMVFGAATVVLVGLHLGGRVAYFRTNLSGRTKIGKRLGVVMAGFGALLAVSIHGGWPAGAVVAGSYEARKRAAIVRGSPVAGFLEAEGARFVARSEGGADARVGLLIKLQEGLNAAPALAVWAETTTGAMIETLYLDERLAFSEEVKWGGATVGRHQVLPIWRHRHTMVSGIDPTGEVDAFTAATPTHTFSLDDYLKLGEAREFVICLEARSADGGPSVLWTTYVDLGDGKKDALLELTGHGGGAEDDGAVRYDLERLDGERNLIDLALVRVEAVR